MKIKYLIYFVIAVIATSCNIKKITNDNTFEIIYTTGPVKADRAAQSFIRIFKKDSTDNFFTIQKGEKFRFTSTNNSNYSNNEAIIYSRKLDSLEFQKIINTINKNNFVKLKHSYNQKDILDGDYRQIKVGFNNKHKTVVCVNYNNQSRFNNIEEEIIGMIKK